MSTEIFLSENRGGCQINYAQPLNGALELPILLRTEEKIIFQIPKVKNHVKPKKIIFESNLAKELGISPYYLAGEVAVKLDDIDMMKFSSEDYLDYQHYKQYQKPPKNIAEFDRFPFTIWSEFKYRATIQFSFPPLINVLERVGKFFTFSQQKEWQEFVQEKLNEFVIDDVASIIIEYLILRMSNFDISVRLE